MQRESKWVQVKEFPNYWIHPDGWVYSAKRNKILKRIENPAGYLYVNLCNETGRKMCFIHTLVLEIFVGPCPDGMEACHGQNGKEDNSVSNLRWDTHQNNMKDISKEGQSSRFMGVCFDKVRQKWRAYKWIAGKVKHLGYFITQEEAVVVYNAA